jgi:GNAT superfamily N-acetyltransferase
MEDVTIRAGTIDDFDALDIVRSAAFAPVFASFRSLVGTTIASVAFRDAEGEQQAHLRELLAPGEGRIMLVAERDGVACGFCAVTWQAKTGVGEIGLNAVHPTAQGRGVGQRLYEAAIDRMRAEGMRVATVGTGGDDSHASARTAYRKAGFSAAVPSLHLYRVL